LIWLFDAWICKYTYKGLEIVWRVRLKEDTSPSKINLFTFEGVSVHWKERLKEGTSASKRNIYTIHFLREFVLTATNSSKHKIHQL